MFAAYIQGLITLYFIIEANIMNPQFSQNSLVGIHSICSIVCLRTYADKSRRYCLQYRIPKNISRQESRRQVIFGGKSGQLFIILILNFECMFYIVIECQIMSALIRAYVVINCIRPGLAQA